MQHCVNCGAWKDGDSMKLKFCGICREQDVQYVNEVKPDFAGFVFAKSKRQITWETAKKFRQQMDPQIRTVGVFVNEKTDVILSYVQEKIIDFVQLHGDETNEQILEIKEKTGAKIIKAVRAKNVESIRRADEMDCDYLLIDAYQPGNYGGTGICFDWNMIPNNLKHPFFLAGGLNASNIKDAKEQVSAYAFDISGGIETDGKKDIEKMKQIKQIGDE